MPQTADTRPFTRLFHDFAEALISARLNGCQWSLVMHIYRNTEGRVEKRADGAHISLAEFARTTGYDKSHIRAELVRLVRMKLVHQVEEPRFSKPAKWLVNVDHKTWILERGGYGKTPTVGETHTVLENSTPTVGEYPTPTVGENKHPLRNKENLKKKKESKSAKADPRFQPFVEYATKAYQEAFDLPLQLNNSDRKALSGMLKVNPGEQYSLENLKVGWDRFLSTEDRFTQDQLHGHGIRYFANNVNRFLVGDGDRGSIVHSRNNRTLEEICEPRYR